jgi:hypothetical protein
MEPAELKAGGEPHDGVTWQADHKGGDDHGERRRGFAAELGIGDFKPRAPVAPERERQADDETGEPEHAERGDATGEGLAQQRTVVAPEGARHELLHADAEAEIQEVEQPVNAHQCDPEAVALGAEVVERDGDLRERAEDGKHLGTH